MSHESEEKVFTKLNIIRSSMCNVILLNGKPHIRVGVTHGTGRFDEPWDSMAVGQH